MKKLTPILLVLLLLAGCVFNEKTAKKHGRGISVEIGDMDDISYVGIKIYADRLIFSDDFIYKEEDFFQPGEIVWFDAPVFPGDHFQDFEVIYSGNRDGSDSSVTNRVDITEAKEWVNTKLTNKQQLELSEFQ